MDRELDLKDKFCGCLLASALGDAIGEIAFSCSSLEALEQRLGRTDLLHYTDDTAMAVGLADSISSRCGLDSRHLGDTFRTNFMQEPWRGYASGPPTVFSLVGERGLSYTEAAGRLFGGSGSFGNGAAMRIGPVGVYFFDAPDLYEQARIASTVTHTHPVGIDGAAVLSKAVAQAVSLQSNDRFPQAKFLENLLQFARSEVIRGKLEQVRDLLDSNSPAARAAGELGRGVAVQESMPFALYAFLLHPQRFEECLFCAVLNGGDCDTLGAMACSISGAYLGAGALPRAWLDRLENRGLIQDLAVRLLEAR